ncbi:MAG TPA: hypothetical protein VGG37_03680, partial [Opitutaceae bacterium]
MDPAPLTRREALRAAALAGAALAAGGALRAQAAAPLPAPLHSRRLNIGVATYSLRKLPTDAAVAALRLLGVTSASAF